jgi:methionine aminopeptidase
MINDKVLQRYISSSKICKVVLDEIILKIQKSQILLLKELHLYGNTRLQEECDKFTNEKIHAIAFPTSISLNNCVGNYLYNDDQKINPGDIVKIQLGINLSGCIVNIGETIYYNEHNEDDKAKNDHQKYLNLLKDLQNKIKQKIISGNTNDDVKILIESTCTQSGCFPVENTISYQHLDGQEFTDESKYIITNYKKYYDNDDYLIVPQNTCFEFECGEIYTVKLIVIPNNFDNSDETQHQYIQNEQPHIYRFNDTFYDLKLKMSREFVSRTKKEYGTNAFNAIEYGTNGKSRVAIKQCCENGILEEYPISFSKDKYNVYHKIFTIIVNKNSSIIL